VRGVHGLTTVIETKSGDAMSTVKSFSRRRHVAGALVVKQQLALNHRRRFGVQAELG